MSQIPFIQIIPLKSLLGSTILIEITKEQKDILLVDLIHEQHNIPKEIIRLVGYGRDSTDKSLNTFKAMFNPRDEAFRDPAFYIILKFDEEAVFKYNFVGDDGIYYSLKDIRPKMSLKDLKKMILIQNSFRKSFNLVFQFNDTIIIDKELEEKIEITVNECHKVKIITSFK